MRTIIDAIRAADLAAFDVTELNPNVMFELGYAIDADRKIWPLRETPNASGQREWERLTVLMPIGYTGYVNSADITRDYYVQQPAHAARTIFQDSIADSLQPPSIPLLFYACSLYETDADRFVYRPAPPGAAPWRIRSHGRSD